MSLGKSKRKDPSPFNKEQGICRDASGAVIPCEEGGLVRKKASPLNKGGGPEEAAENIEMLKDIGHRHGLGKLVGGIPYGIWKLGWAMAGEEQNPTGMGAEHGATNLHPADTIHGKRLQDNRMKRQGRGPVEPFVKVGKSKKQTAKVPLSSSMMHRNRGGGIW